MSPGDRVFVVLSESGEMAVREARVVRHAKGNPPSVLGLVELRIIGEEGTRVFSDTAVFVSRLMAEHKVEYLST